MGRAGPGGSSLAGWGFPWPDTIVSFGGPGADLELDLPETGWLGHLGYSVCAGGCGKRERHRTLDRAFTEPLPSRGFKPKYVEEWGRPGSAKRLEKLARTLAALCRNAKRREANMEDPIDLWETDLAWLKQEYYEGRKRFPWPRT